VTALALPDITGTTPSASNRLLISKKAPRFRHYDERQSRIRNEHLSGFASLRNGLNMRLARGSETAAAVLYIPIAW